MIETLKTIITDNSRSIWKKTKTSPILYLFFTAMIIFSIIMFAFLTLFLQQTETQVSLIDMFFTVFFIFLMKTTADFYNHFIKSPQISYPLSTQIKQTKTITEIYLAILIIQLTIWFTFSALYLLFANALGININYPLEYLYFTIGIVIATMIGCTISIHYFSRKRYRLLPTIILLAFYWQAQSILFIMITLPIALLHLIWSIRHAMESYRFVNRKERTKEKNQAKTRDTISALFNREITVLWRDRLLFSFIFTAISSALFTGYFVIYGSEILLPETIREMAADFLPSMFVFLGIYVVVIYTSVFPSLNLFLNEEKTMWILRNLPLKNETIIYGKASSLALCFLTAIPFLAYISIFIGLERIVFLSWFLVFSYIAGVIISVPLGAKYVGKKSDILLLYSVAMILFVVLGFAGAIGNLVERFLDFGLLIYLFILLVEIGVLWLSLKLSAQILYLKSG